MHAGCSSGLQLSFTWPVSTGLPRSCVHDAVTLDLLERVNVLRITPGCPRLLLRAVSCPTPRLASTSRAESVPSLSRLSRSATFRGINDSVCAQCLGVAVGDVEEDASASTVDSTFRHHAARSCWQSLWLATLLRHLSERCGQHVIVEDFGLCCFSFGDFSLSVLQVPHVAEHIVPVVGTVEESSELEAFSQKLLSS